MNTGGFVSMNARSVVSMAQEQIRVARERYHSERKDYIDYYYYQTYVRRRRFLNIIRSVFGMRPIVISDSETFYQEFDDSAISFSEMLSLNMVGLKHYMRIQTLCDILPIAEAALNNGTTVQLNSEYCCALGYGPGLIPLTPEAQERQKAEQEIEDAVRAYG